MSGYRQSKYDPDAHDTPGKPLRPFNWVQWTGVAFEVAGITLMLIDIAETVGWLPAWADMPPLSAIALMLIGMTLINTRREPSTQTTPEQRAANNRLLIITIAVCAVVVAAAFAIDLLGA